MYRDLIENADKIVSIARNSETVLANIRSIQVGHGKHRVSKIWLARPWPPKL